MSEQSKPDAAAAADSEEQLEGASVEESAAEEQTPGNETLDHEQLLLSLQDAQAKADEHWNQLLSARAELENARRRAQREVESAHKFALEKFVRELLPVKDSLELGLAAAEGEAAEVGKLREGMELTLKMLAGAMEKFGVEEVNPVGQKFNPEYHQAMATQAAPGKEPNAVLTVYQKGYLLNERLIRPAMVVVASATEQPKGGHIDEQA